MEFEKVCRVLYKYEPVEEGELALEEEAIVYIWDSSNPEWWSASLEMGQTADEVTTGLIPYNYVEEMEHLGKARALYSYEALNPDELSFEENDEFYIYQKEGQDWMMVYFNNKYGFVPQSYIEEIQEDGNEDVGGYVGYETEQDVPSFESPPSDMAPAASTPVILDSKSTAKTPKDDMLFWRVAEVDKKKKNKKKVRLGISSDTLFVGSEEDKSTPVRQWPISDLKKYGIKNKHIIIELSGSKPGTFDFSCSSIKQAEAVAFKIRSCSQAVYDDKSANKGSGGWFGKFKKKSSTPKAPPAKLNQDSINNNIRPDQRILQEKNASSPLPDLPLENSERRPNNSNRYNTNSSVDNSNSSRSNLPQTDSTKTPQMAPAKSPKPPTREEMEGEIAIVLYNFTGVEEDELSVQAEERINVIDKTSDSQWWRCRVYYDNGQFKEGLVPSDYVSLATDENNIPSKTASSASKEVLAGPHPDKLREWTDATGSFKVEAEFLKYEDGKIHLHKANGVRIAVPLEKMCAIDVHFVSEAIGEDLSSDLTEVKRAKAEASRWKEFFVLAGITANDADNYASTFTREKIDRLLLKEIDRSTLKGLGLTEGDALRVEKAAQSSAISKAPKQKRSVTFGDNTTFDTESDEALALRLQREENNRHRKDLASSDLRDYQIEQDELLARKLQEENDPTGSWQNFSSKSDQANKKYGLGLGGSKGNGKGKQSGVNFDTLFEASAKLEEENKRSQSHKKDAAPLVTSKSKSSGFDDEIWGAPGSRPTPRQPSRTSSFDAFSKPSTGVDPWQPFSDKPTVPEPVEKPVFGSGSQSRKDSKSRLAIEESWSAVKANFEKQQTTGSAASTPPQSQTNVSQAPPQPAVNKNVFTSTNTAALPQPLIPIPKGSTSSVFIPTRRPPPPKPVSNIFADVKSTPVVTGGLTTRTGTASPGPNPQSLGNNVNASNVFASNLSIGTQGPFNVPETQSTNTGNSLFTPSLSFVDSQGTIAPNPSPFQNNGFLSNTSNFDTPKSFSSSNISFESKNIQSSSQSTFNANPGPNSLFSTTSNYQPSSMSNRTNNQFDELSLEKLGLKTKPSSQRGFTDASSFQPPRSSSALGGGFGVDSMQQSSQLNNASLLTSSSFLNTTSAGLTNQHGTHNSNPGSFTGLNSASNYQSSVPLANSINNAPASNQSYQTGYLSGIGDNRNLRSLGSQAQGSLSQINNNAQTNFSSNLSNDSQFKSYQNPSNLSSNTTLQNQSFSTNYASLTGNLNTNLKSDSFSTDFNSNSLSSFNNPVNSHLNQSSNFMSTQTNGNNYSMSNLNPSNSNNNNMSNLGGPLNQLNPMSNLGGSLNQHNTISNIGSSINQNNNMSNLGSSLNQNNNMSNLGSSLNTNLNNGNLSSNYAASNSLGLGTISSNSYQTPSNIGNSNLLSSNSLSMSSSLNNNSAFSGINPLFNPLTSAKNSILPSGSQTHNPLGSSGSLGLGSQTYNPPGSLGFGSQTNNLLGSSSNQGLGYSQSNQMYGTSSNPTLSTQMGFNSTKLDQPSSYSTPGFSQPSNQLGYGASNYGQSPSQSGYGTSSYGQSSNTTSGYGQSSAQSNFGQSLNSTSYSTGLNSSSNQQGFTNNGYGQSSTFQNGYGTTGFNQNSNQQQGYGYNQGR